MAHKNIQPAGWAPAKGYANAILSRNGTLYLGGQVGWNAQQIFEATDFIGQMRQVLLNIVAILNEAGAEVEDLTRMTWFVTDKTTYMANQQEIGRVYREVLGRHFPAMSLVVVAGLVEEGALLEIEATAELKQP